jgi:hypothetical protein
VVAVVTLEQFLRDHNPPPKPAPDPAPATKPFRPIWMPDYPGQEPPF